MTISTGHNNLRFFSVHAQGSRQFPNKCFRSSASQLDIGRLCVMALWKQNVSCKAHPKMRTNTGGHSTKVDLVLLRYLFCVLYRSNYTFTGISSINFLPTCKVMNDGKAGKHWMQQQSYVIIKEPQQIHKTILFMFVSRARTATRPTCCSLDTDSEAVTVI